MNSSITRRDILRQLKADLIGKDSYRGVTLTYTWLANQFGHISLGFIPTFILFIFLSRYYGNDIASFRASVIISITWLIFETFNFLGPLLSTMSLKKRISLDALQKQYIFQPAWGNVAFDTITDIGFFWLGAFFSSSLCSSSVTPAFISLIIASLLIYPAYYWYPTKMYLQIPQYPFQFRLSQWEMDHIGEEDKNNIQKFLNNHHHGMHLLIFGSKNSGKTSISVGIATELSIKHNPCFYITAMKLFSMFFDADERPSSLWNWRSSSVLVIDDINAGYPIKQDLISPEHFLKLIDTYSTQNEVNRNAIKNTNTIWVLGSRETGEDLSGKWHRMLENIGVPKINILSVNLP